MKTDIEGVIRSRHLTFPMDVKIKALARNGDTYSVTELEVSDVDRIVEIIQTDAPGSLAFYVYVGDLVLYPKLQPPRVGSAFSRHALPDVLHGPVRMDSPATMGPLNSYSNIPSGGALDDLPNVAQSQTSSCQSQRQQSLFYVPSLADFSAAFGPPPASEPPPGVSDSEPPTTAFELQAVSEPPTASIELQTDSEPPTAAVPPLLAPRMCAFCNKLGPLHKKCGRCLRTRYCDRQCQLRHWQEHKTECVPTDCGVDEADIALSVDALWGASTASGGGDS